jgi:DNA polymerase
VSRPVDAVIEFLEAEKARGVSHILLDEDARDGLRALLRRTRPTNRKAVQRPAQVEAVEPAAPPATITAGSGSKTAQLAALRAQAENWAPARSLGTLRETMVFATGNPDARIMLVGEAPGYEEEKKREPFVGSAGQKLMVILSTMGLTREEVYLSNMVKFRPATLRQTTNNRPPNPQEIAACLPFIRAEVEIVKPECIIALGATAAMGLLEITGPVRSARGSWHEFGGIPVRVTYHPSYLLHDEKNLIARRQLWEDMLAVMERLGMPISDRQRGFFLTKSSNTNDDGPSAGMAVEK